MSIRLTDNMKYCTRPVVLEKTVSAPLILFCVFCNDHGMIIPCNRPSDRQDIHGTRKEQARLDWKPLVPHLRTLFLTAEVFYFYFACFGKHRLNHLLFEKWWEEMTILMDIIWWFTSMISCARFLVFSKLRTISYVFNAC